MTAVVSFSPFHKTCPPRAAPALAPAGNELQKTRIMKTRLPFTKESRVRPAALGLALIASASLAWAADYEWTFNGGDLSASLGAGIMSYADAQTSTLTTFGTTDGTTVPHIGGVPAQYFHVPQLPSQANGFYVELTATGANGGGSYVNQYTFVMDLLVPAPLDWTALLNTAPDNPDSNDADFYIAGDGSVGIGSDSAAGLFQANTWNRLAVSVNTAGNMLWFLNGTQVHSRGGGGLDGRWSLYSNADAGPDIRLLNEGDTSGNYTHEMYVNSLFLTDRAMTDAEIAALGGAQAGGVMVPEPGTWALLGLGAMAFVAWRRTRKN